VFNIGQTLILSAALVLTFTACSSWKSETFSKDNHDTVLTDAGKHASDDEKAKLASAAIRSTLAGYDLDGKTVLDEQTTFEAEQKAEEAAEHEVQLKAEAKRAEIVRQIASDLAVVPISKGFSPNNYMGSTMGGYEPHGDEVTLTVLFKNKSAKVITAFKGRLVFSNAFGDKIYSIGYDEAERMSPGATITHDGGVDFNNFEADEQKFRGLELSQMKSRFEATAVSFADGSTLVAPEAKS
jgi:hypothetical protein